tara:strand:+ start:1304 stop:1516 length:213 start_codon:yes stop_codon:yes gene_type:complete
LSDNAPYLAIPKSPHPLLATSGSLKAQLGLSVVWGCVERVGLQERHFYLRTNFKLNRAAALVEWRQLLSA